MLFRSQRQFIEFEKNKGAKTNPIDSPTNTVINGKAGCEKSGLNPDCKSIAAETAFPKAVTSRGNAFRGSVCSKITTIGPAN